MSSYLLLEDPPNDAASSKQQSKTRRGLLVLTVLTVLTFVVVFVLLDLYQSPDNNTVDTTLAASSSGSSYGLQGNKSELAVEFGFVRAWAMQNSSELARIQFTNMSLSFIGDRATDGTPMALSSIIVNLFNFSNADIWPSGWSSACIEVFLTANHQVSSIVLWDAEFVTPSLVGLLWNTTVNSTAAPTVFLQYNVTELGLDASQCAGLSDGGGWQSESQTDFESASFQSQPFSGPVFSTTPVPLETEPVQVSIGVHVVRVPCDSSGAGTSVNNGVVSLSVQPSYPYWAPSFTVPARNLQQDGYYAATIDLSSPVAELVDQSCATLEEVLVVPCAVDPVILAASCPTLVVPTLIGICEAAVTVVAGLCRVERLFSPCVDDPSCPSALCGVLNWVTDQALTKYEVSQSVNVQAVVNVDGNVYASSHQLFGPVFSPVPVVEMRIPHQPEVCTFTGQWGPCCENQLPDCEAIPSPTGVCPMCTRMVYLDYLWRYLRDLDDTGVSQWWGPQCDKPCPGFTPGVYPPYPAPRSEPGCLYGLCYQDGTCYSCAVDFILGDTGFHSGATCSTPCPASCYYCNREGTACQGCVTGWGQLCENACPSNCYYYNPNHWPDPPPGSRCQQDGTCAGCMVGRKEKKEKRREE